MRGVSKETRALVRQCVRNGGSLEALANSMENVSFKTKAAAVGMKALSTVGNILANTLATLVVSLVINGIIKMANAYKEMVEQASRATDTFKEQSRAIGDYRDRIEELKTALSSENISYTEARDKRSELLDIQKQLINTYGEEVKGIDLVNGSLDEQLDKLDELNEKKRQDWENDVNKMSWGEKWGKFAGLTVLSLSKLIGDVFLGPFAKILTKGDYQYSLLDDLFNKQAVDWISNSNIDRIQQRFKYFRKTIDIGQAGDDLKSQLASFNNISLNGDKMTIVGDAKAVEDTILQIQSQIVSSRKDLGWLDEKLKNIANSAGKIVDETWDTYNTSIQNEILDDEKGREYYKKLSEEYKNYQNAVKDGNEESANAAKDNLSNIFTAISKDVSNGNIPESFKQYFESMYVDISDIVSKWKFEVQISPKISTNENGIKDSIGKLGDITTEEISAAFRAGGEGVSPEQRNAIFSLNSIATSNGLSLDELLSQLRDAGYLVNQLDKDIKTYAGKLNNTLGGGVDWESWFKEKEIDTQEELDKFISITKGAKTAKEAVKMYEDEIARGLIDSLESLNKKLDTIQSAYQSVLSAIKEYNEEGYLSVDTYQALMGIEPEYLKYIMDEEGQLRLGTDAMNDYTAALIDNMAKKQMMAIVDYVTGLDEEARQLYLNREAAEDASEGLAAFANSLIYAKVTAGELTQEDANKVLKMLDGVIAWAEKTKDGIGEGGLGGQSAKDLSDRIDDIKRQLKELADSEALEKLKYRFDIIEQSITNITNSISLLDNTLNSQAEDDYIGRLETVTEQLSLAQQKSVLLRNEFNELNNTTYNSANEANELATRMKSVADSIADNSKNIMDYGKNMVEYYMSAMSMIGNLSDNTIERATSLFERNVKTLQEGGLAGLQFNLSPTVPQSAYERQRDENRKLEDEMRDYYDTVAKMQKTALDMQYQETVEDNNRKRQELNDSLNEALLEQRGYSDKSINLQRRTNEITSAEQKRDNAEKLAEAKSFSAAILDVANNLSESTKKITIDPPHFSTGWNDLKDEFKRRMNEAWESAGSSQGAIDVPYYNQGDYANNRYGNGTIATSGCGPTAMAMVLSSFDKDVDPVTAANYSMSHGFYANGQGTSWDYFDSIAKEYGIKSQVIGTTARSIKKALSNGDKLIVSMAPGYFTKNGHFIVLSGITDDGKVFVSDPGSRERSNQTWDVKLIADEARQAWAFSAYAAGTSGAVGGTSLVGEKGKELGILPNGKVIELGKHGAELVDIPKGTQIFNHEQTEEIEKYTGNLDGKSIPKYATGTLSGYSDLGNLDVVTQLPKLSVEQIRKLIEKYFSRPNSVVKLSDAEGIYKAQMDSGISALATLAIGALESTYGTSPIAQEKGNLWGYGAVDSNPMGGAHKYSATVGEAAQKYSAELYKDFYEGWNEKTIYEMGNKYASDKQWKNKVTNIMGNFTKSLTSSGLDEITASATQPATSETYLEDIAANTKAIRQDFETRLEGWLNGNIDTETSNTIEDDLLKYISDKIDKSAYNNEEFIKKWDKFQAINTESQKVFKDLDKSLLESVGTSNYNTVKDEVLKTVSGYTNTMMKTSSDATLAELKNQYNLNKSVADMMLAFYNQKKAEGATAGELSVIIEKYNEQLDKVNDISDKWISTLQSQTEYLKTQDNLALQSHDNALSWQEKANERLLKQYENTDENDIAARKALETQIVDSYNQIIAENQNKKNTAHQNVLDLYNDERYLPIFQRYDVEEWFDASGEATAKYNEELAALSATDSELAGIMQQLFERIQPNKQAWYTADETIQTTNDSLKDFEKTKKLNQVDMWEKYQNRLIEVTDYQKKLNDAITDAKKIMYDFNDSLREEANSITSELQANMHLGEWLSEDTRNQLFNMQDYTAEMNKINDLRIRMESLYTKYQSDINGLKEEESWQAEKITAEYNKQVEALQDKLSIAKQSLQVAKDQAAIENAMKERDTQIIMGNRVQNVADPDKLYELEQAAQQSKLELQNLGTKAKEAADIRNMERVSDNYSFDMSAIQNNLDMLGDMTDKEKELFSNFLEPTETITAKLNSIAKQDPWYMIANDKSTDVYINLDKDSIRGYNLAYDYEAAAAMMAKFMGAAGFDDYETNKVIEYLQKNHDNKTITDSHNLGYPKHYPNEDALKERYPLPIYNEETITDILTSAGVNISKEVVSDVLQTISATVLDNGVTLTGNADYDTNKLPNGITLTGDADYSISEPKYRYVSLEDKFPGVDFSSLITTPLYSVIDSIANSKILANDKAMSVINNMGDNVTDNSIHIDNVNITKPIKTADEIVSSLVQKASTLAKTTNNQR